MNKRVKVLTNDDDDDDDELFLDHYTIYQMTTYPFDTDQKRWMSLPVMNERYLWLGNDLQ